MVVPSFAALQIVILAEFPVNNFSNLMVPLSISLLLLLEIIIAIIFNIIIIISFVITITIITIIIVDYYYYYYSGHGLWKRRIQLAYSYSSQRQVDSRSRDDLPAWRLSYSAPQWNTRSEPVLCF